MSGCYLLKLVVVENLFIIQQQLASKEKSKSERIKFGTTELNVRVTMKETTNYNVMNISGVWSSNHEYSDFFQRFKLNLKLNTFRDTSRRENRIIRTIKKSQTFTYMYTLHENGPIAQNKIEQSIEETEMDRPRMESQERQRGEKVARRSSWPKQFRVAR